MRKDYAIHPLAETYPPMSEAEMEALTADIAARGLQRPIVLHESKILDGRNRYLACKRANVEPSYVEYEGNDALGQVNSLNLNRDLTAGQRAIIAARQWMLNGDTKDKGKGRRGGDDVGFPHHSAESLTKHHRTDRKAMTQARDLLIEAPDLAAMVESCSRSLTKATEELEKRRADANREAKDAERASKISSEFRELISDGQLSAEEAVQEIVRRDAEERDRLKRETEARQIWFEELAHVLKWAKEWVASRTDEYLAWYTEEGSPETGHRVTRDEIEACIVQLGRIKSITLKGNDTDEKPSNGQAGRRATGSSKDRAGTP